jgi:hypothetical protein
MVVSLLAKAEAVMTNVDEALGLSVDQVATSTEFGTEPEPTKIELLSAASHVRKPEFVEDAPSVLR